MSDEMNAGSVPLPPPLPDAAASPSVSTSEVAKPHKRRPRYSGNHPRRFEEKYKEHNPERYEATVAKVLASGKTPAGMHRPIMVDEILEVLGPKPGDVAADCTLGYGGHAEAMLARLLPGGKLLGLDVDPLELPRTEARLRVLGYSEDVFQVRRSNFAGLPQVIAQAGLDAVDVVLADLGVSSMQIDDPSRGFSVKLRGPLDMRMNPQRGQPASVLLERMSASALAGILAECSDEPRAEEIAAGVAGRAFTTTTELANAVLAAVPKVRDPDERALTVRRVFQAVRIVVNDEFSALETFLRQLPFCLRPGGRVAVLTFHSGEDRRVKKAFQAGAREGVYSDVARDVVRASEAEQRSNPRSAPAKLRWAIKARPEV